jgi:hypothetical protein
MRLYLMLSVGFVFYTSMLLAQENTYGKVSIASPNAAALSKYADIPVNNHTGAPSIEIPLYSVREGSLTMPVNISYHASGLKVMEPSGWIGIGWTLNAGGVITRTVQGTPDEKWTGVVYNETGHFSDYGYNNYFYTGIQAGTETPFRTGIKDGEPDLFFFNFGSYSGKFYFNDDRVPVFVPEQDIKLEYDYIGLGSIRGFTLISSDGTKYFFGKTADPNDTDPVETSYSYTSSNGANYGSAISSWYLNKVQSADGLFSITLTYDPDQLSYCTYSMSTLNGTDNTSREYDLVKNFINGVRLKQINFSTGSVNFIAGLIRQDVSQYNFPLDMAETVNTNSKSLGSIVITGNGTACKKFVLTQSYFENNSTLTGYFADNSYNNLQADRKRLKLEKIQEFSCDDSKSLPPHLFE